MQDLAPPSLESGTSLSSCFRYVESHTPMSTGATNTLGNILSSHLPLLFPSKQRQLAYPMVQGVVCPADAEIAWLGACMAGADGWVNVMIGIS